MHENLKLQKIDSSCVKNYKKEYSLPLNTSIFDKVNLHQFNFNYFQLLNTYTDIEKYIIHEEEKKNTKNDDAKDTNYLKKIRAFDKYFFNITHVYLEKKFSFLKIEKFNFNFLQKYR